MIAPVRGHHADELLMGVVQVVFYALYRAPCYVVAGDRHQLFLQPSQLVPGVIRIHKAQAGGVRYVGITLRQNVRDVVLVLPVIPVAVYHLV